MSLEVGLKKSRLILLEDFLVLLLGLGDPGLRCMYFRLFHRRSFFLEKKHLELLTLPGDPDF